MLLLLKCEYTNHTLRMAGEQMNIIQRVRYGERDLVSAIIIQPVCTWCICLKDTNDCNLTAMEGDCNELVTVCLMNMSLKVIIMNNQKDRTIFSLALCPVAVMKINESVLYYYSAAHIQKS